MKTSIVVILLVTGFLANTTAQISLEHSYITDQPNQSEQFTVNLSISGIKYVSLHRTGISFDYIKLYNTNHSVFKTIQVPQISGWDVTGLAYISETLFDLNSLIEFLVCYQSGAFYQTFVYNENGTSLLNVPDGFWTLGITNLAQPIVSLEDSTKLILKMAPSGGSDFTSTNVYSLPGRLPCYECQNNPVVAGVPSFHNHLNRGLSLPYPNPTNSTIKIKYELPSDFHEACIKIFNMSNQLVHNFIIDSTYKEIMLSNDDLPSGEYFYSIEVDNIVLESNKYILIK